MSVPPAISLPQFVHVCFPLWTFMCRLSLNLCLKILLQTLHLCSELLLLLLGSGANTSCPRWCSAPGDCSCGDTGGGGEAGGRLVREAGPGLRSDDLSPGDFSCGEGGDEEDDRPGAGPGQLHTPGDFSCGASGSSAVAVSADTDTNEGGDEGGQIVREAGPGLRTPGDFSCGASGSQALAATADTDTNEGGDAGGRLVREVGPGPGQIHSPGDCSCG